MYEEIQKNYEQTIESIKTYGGFYIGRYETGNLSQKKPVCVQYNEDMYGEAWYTMYNKTQYMMANANVKSMMIYGSLWDEVLMWLYESGAKSYYAIGDDSESWGNYGNTSFNYYTTAEATTYERRSSSSAEKLPTGTKAGSNSDNWKRNCANNIYDLAGNVADWTQEIYVNSERRVGRGGSYYVWGNRMPAGYRGYLTVTSSEDYYYTGCRGQLIIL